MLLKPVTVLAVAGFLGMTATAGAADPASLFKSQAALFGLAAVNDKIETGAAHLLCREAAVAATTPAMPWSPSRRSAAVAYEDLAPALTATAARADRLLIEGLREGGMADASAETVAALSERVRKGLSSRLFQVNPASASEMAVACRALAADDFGLPESRMAAR
ncbi:hypothetical protein L2U69_18885 [Zavarzinia compransoris]|uniref:hypothetical protein n=1 Tax=Zavarzinia marina TaxID=2911065 RepID=UPI001F379D72|nr:hypothetical protein [Zavarzinia marina]MCF4167719.1 hypothetical protein [Zavarzinia marina]